MSNDRHVVGLCGSRRDGSHTRRALERALSAARSAGATTDLVDTAALDLPTFDPETPDAGDAPALRRRVRTADGVVLGTPTYHGSYASPLKTALDYCGFDEFERTAVGLLAVSGGAFPTPALEHLRSVARALDAWVLTRQVAVPNASDAFEGGHVTDANLADRIEALGRDVVEHARLRSDPDAAGSCAIPVSE